MKLFATLMTVFLLHYAGAQSTPCGAREYRQFDFWIGSWEAFGPNGKKAGDSKIEVILDSCTIQENWLSVAAVKGVRFAGKSYNGYNAVKQKWQQYWVDNTGSTTEYFDGHFENDKMILQTDNVRQTDGTTKILRMTFFNLGPNKVRQFGESSTDGGKNWKTDFDLEYRRKQ